MLATRRQTRQRTAPALAGTLWTGSVVVPARFLGMHFHRWPEAREGAASITTAPQFRFHVVRSHDYSGQDGGLHWYGIEPTQGGFQWTVFDKWVDTHYSAGRDLYWQVYGTPAWAAKSGMEVVADAYGKLGGAAPPQSQATISAFVTAVISRYVARGTPIKYIGVWNEPHFDGPSGGFWWGTAAELATLARTVKLAAKAADPSITVMSPDFLSMQTPETRIPAFLNASDGSGGFGRDHCDAVAYHPYGITLGGNLGATAGSPQDIDTALRAALVAGGLASNFPVHATEQGVGSPQGGRHSAKMFGQFLCRATVRLLSLGWKSAIWYSSDSGNDYWIGRPSYDSVVAGYLDKLSELAGKTLTRVDVLSDGSWLVQTSTSSYVW